MELTNVNNETYEVIVQNASYLNVKRIRLYIGVKKDMNLNELLTIVKECMEPYRNDYDIILADVQKHGNGKSMNKELLKAEWVSPLLDEMKLKPYKNNDGNGYYWQIKEPELMDSEAYAIGVGMRGGLMILSNYLVAGAIKSVKSLLYSIRKHKTKN